MKKTITLITIISMMLMTIFAFSACGTKEEEVKTEEPVAEVQTEEAVVEEEAPVEEENNPLADTLWEMKMESTGAVISSVKFNKDKTLEYTRNPYDEWAVTKGTYEIDGNNVKITYNDDDYYNKVKEANAYNDEIMNTMKEYDNTATWTIDGDKLTVKFNGYEGYTNDNGFAMFPENESTFVKAE